jgi:hypothetical protein
MKHIRDTQEECWVWINSGDPDLFEQIFSDQTREVKLWVPKAPDFDLFLDQRVWDWLKHDRERKLYVYTLDSGELEETDGLIIGEISPDSDMGRIGFDPSVLTDRGYCGHCLESEDSMKKSHSRGEAPEWFWILYTKPAPSTLDLFTSIFRKFQARVPKLG